MTTVKANIFNLVERNNFVPKKIRGEFPIYNEIFNKFLKSFRIGYATIIGDTELIFTDQNGKLFPFKETPEVYLINGVDTTTGEGVRIGASNVTKDGFTALPESPDETKIMFIFYKYTEI